MLGAIIGDVIGRPYEIYPVKYRDFELLSEDAGVTDDTMMTCAIASAILRDRSYGDEMKAWYASSQGKIAYGNRFEDWATSDFEGDSIGNGCAMRVSAIAWLAPDLRTALAWAADSARPSHNHPESIAAAQATVAAARLGIERFDRAFMGRTIQAAYGYDLAMPLEAYRADYTFEITATPTVMPSLRAVVELETFEDVLRNAISMGGDADTMAAIAGGVAEAFMPIPDDIRAYVIGKLPGAVREVLAAFDARRAAMQAFSRTAPDDVLGILRTAYADATKPRTGLLARWKEAFSRAKK